MYGDRWEYNSPKSLGYNKSSSKREFIAIQAYLKQSNLTPKELGKEKAQGK